MDLQVVLIIDLLDDKVNNTVEMDLGNNQLVGDLKTSRSELSEKGQST